jgi:hypothetical protein
MAEMRQQRAIANKLLNDKMVAEMAAEEAAKQRGRGQSAATNDDLRALDASLAQLQMQNAAGK